jgi:hypothetical protein
VVRRLARDAVVGSPAGVPDDAGTARPVDGKSFLPAASGKSQFLPRGPKSRSWSRLMDEADLQDARQVAHALCSEARQRNNGGDPAAAVALFDDVVTRFGPSGDDYLQQTVVYALAHRAAIRAQRPELASGAEPTPDLLARFEQAEAPSERGRLARAIVSETVVLTRTDRHGESMALSEEFVAAVADNDGPEVRSKAAIAFQNLVESLNGQGRTAEAEEALTALAARFGSRLRAKGAATLPSRLVTRAAASS